MSAVKEEILPEHRQGYFYLSGKTNYLCKDGADGEHLENK